MKRQATIHNLAAWRQGGKPISLIPFPWFGQFWQPLSIYRIVLDWLDREVDPSAPQRMPLLNSLRGWRNREVHEFVSGDASHDWTARLYDDGAAERYASEIAGYRAWMRAHDH